MTVDEGDATEELVGSVDVIVLGAGMAGMTVAASLAQQGLSCALIEAGPEIGGSAVLSEGYVWTAVDREHFVAQDPLGNADRFDVMRGGLEAAFTWLGSLGVGLGSPIEGVLGFGAGRQIDVRAYVARWLAIVEAAGGFVLRGTRAISATRVENADERLVVTVESDVDGQGRIGCVCCVAATGGFQVSAAHRDEWFTRPIAALAVRSNPFSDGGGIELGLALGGGLSRPAGGFYGHLIPHALPNFGPADFSPMAQLFSEHAILVTTDGTRFTDESRGDHINANVVAERGRALVIVDERVRREQVMRPFLPGMEAADRMAMAGERGAHYVVGATLAEIAKAAGQWGYDAARLEQTVIDYNEALAADRPLEVPRARHRTPLSEPPYAALEVQAAITFTYRGLQTDLDGRVLGDEGPVPGLYAAGIDAGDVNDRGYSGGLVRGLVLGRRTAAAVGEDVSRYRDRTR